MSLEINGENINEKFEMVEMERQGLLDNRLPENASESEQAAIDSIEPEPDQINVVIRLGVLDDRPVTARAVDFSPVPTEEKEDSLQEQLQFFFDLRDSGKIFSVGTPERYIEEAQLLSIVYTRTSNLSYRVQLVFRQVRIQLIEDERGEDVEGSESNEGQRPGEEAYGWFYDLLDKFDRYIKLGS